ncbi:porin [Thalassospira xiamenensis]|uniref:Outer membrane protein (Porin) n=1 Tax=Thalassospira xiamenensis TaxID=220697 RepID=A0A285T8S7_9PROT|nr:porin [Thalassospira xiamenensis]SOC17350.1 Outer membrane protein (porin) [Thalassospira xiamenensis]
MKKILIASSALVVVAFAGQAQASEKIKLSVGGYMEQWAGIADQDRRESRNAFQSDTEIHFKGATTLDNGIEVGAVVELEGETSGDQVDEQYLFVNGGFGQIKLGKDDGAADDMGLIAPAVGPVGVNDGDLTNWVDAYLPDTVQTSDAKRLTYYTPSLGGFRAGVSYADSDELNTDNGTGDNVVSAGLSYEKDFDSWSLGLSAVGENKGEGNWYGLGANVGFGNFTVGGSWGHIEDDYGLSDNDTAGNESDNFDIGVSYAMDAATVSLSYAYADYGNRDTDGGASSTGEISTVDLGLAYALGAGVSWKTSVFWFDDDNDNAAFANDGYGAVTGLRLDF